MAEVKSREPRTQRESAAPMKTTHQGSTSRGVLAWLGRRVDPGGPTEHPAAVPTDFGDTLDDRGGRPLDFDDDSNPTLGLTHPVDLCTSLQEFLAAPLCRCGDEGQREKDGAEHVDLSGRGSWLIGPANEADRPRLHRGAGRSGGNGMSNEGGGQGRRGPTLSGGLGVHRHCSFAIEGAFGLVALNIAEGQKDEGG